MFEIVVPHSYISKGGGEIMAKGIALPPCKPGLNRGRAVVVISYSSCSDRQSHLR